MAELLHAVLMISAPTADKGKGRSKGQRAVEEEEEEEAVEIQIDSEPQAINITYNWSLLVLG